ncbi:dTDP-4-dehydrorhamnose reductase [Yunchengibacter salinarum]|uniref:dTDP-4-dehydrorhamnose reductase n=1 Tax=Yunchengibacter salinarum TaxID=3133399 RepID=UPI0035B60E0A
MHRIAIIGKQGQVARSLAEAAPAHGLEAVFLARPALDLARLTPAQSPALTDMLAGLGVDAVINAAAYTNVDGAEGDEATATTVNATGTAVLADVAARLNVPFLHISTDYVFDGSKPGAYVEHDPVAPMGAYGRSKLAGERAVRAANPHAFIFRTAWVYSPFGKNFLKTMLRLAANRDELGVVADQHGNPTYAPAIADGLLAVLAALPESGWQKRAGLYHMTATGDATWHAFAEAIFDEAARFGHPRPAVKALTTADFPTPAARPANSRLNSARLESTFGVRLPHWRLSTRACVRRLFHQGGL